MNCVLYQILSLQETNLIHFIRMGNIFLQCAIDKLSEITRERTWHAIGEVHCSILLWEKAWFTGLLSVRKSEEMLPHRISLEVSICTVGCLIYNTFYPRHVRTHIHRQKMISVVAFQYFILRRLQCLILVDTAQYTFG